MRWLGSMLLAVGLGCGADAAEHPRGPPPEPTLATVAAVGPTLHLTAAQRRAFAFAEDFEPMPAPEVGGWRLAFPEPSEDFMAFRASGPHFVVVPRTKIYILPIGDLAAAGGPPLPVLREHAQRFFGLSVEVLDAVTVETTRATRRDNGGVEQVHAGELLDHLRVRVPWDAYCVLGLTMEDLYPAEEWNYVFGLASTHDRVGVFSFRRYDPRFYDERAPADPDLVLLRGLKVMSHEIGHMFGINHCDHFRCIMNGSNHVEELDGAPLHLCPVCLRKLHFVTNFDLAARYESLREHYAGLGIAEERNFTARRLARMQP